ncbi:hypothetical protein Rsub_03313 [Raphidocelis subcapitata]|uniref:RRM domain-containing protein n=1 Tax=Raphidocelis subcapitata TaxID=307507 RepID=A0A2V0NX73_9CHLO|nr:hypothetical protein Rsub_03313 [Raphidocelis subcapitata]|eukprot:GBF90180.1 hypothetical protein Rsub_03313 [Raphidocelis subcapitata]
MDVLGPHAPHAEAESAAGGGAAPQHGGAQGGPAAGAAAPAQPPLLRPHPHLPAELQERLGRFLRQLDAGALPPPSPAGSLCGSDACGGGSTVSIAPSDSASCCCVGGAGGGGGGACADDGSDAQAAVERSLARHLRQLQMQAQKAALAAADARAAQRVAAGAGCAPPRGAQLQPGRLCSPGCDAACDALLYCSPSSAASCSGPGGGAGAAAAAVASGAIRPTLLRFGADAAGGPDTSKQPPSAAAPPPPPRPGVFVGNLPSQVTERALMALFSRAGPIDSLWIARDPRSQASLSYGYVVYCATDQAAHLRAARSLDGAVLERSAVRVRLSDRDFDRWPLGAPAPAPEASAAAAAAPRRQRPRPGPVAAVAAAARDAERRRQR